MGLTLKGHDLDRDGGGGRRRGGGVCSSRRRVSLARAGGAVVISGHEAPFTIHVAAARAMGRDLMLRRSMIEESKHGIELECVARARAKIAALSREALGPRSGCPDLRGGRGRPPQGIDQLYKCRRESVRTGRHSAVACEHVDDAAATVGERRAGVGLQRRQNESMHNTVYPRHVAFESPAGGHRGQCACARRRIAGGGAAQPRSDRPCGRRWTADRPPCGP